MINWIVLLIGLLTSAVAAFYSVTGLTSIFTGATVAVIIMGIMLEAGKVGAAAWLHKYWREANLGLKAYLIAAVIILMAITSMGTFGFLSKAHLESTGATSVASEQVKQYDVQLNQIDEDLTRIDRTVGNLDQLVTTAGERGTRVRAGQRSERVLLSTERTELLERRTEITTSRSKERVAVVGAEAELGPIKYIAEMIYGQDADEASFDKAVRWMIILLVLVFDPLAISLLIAAQSGMKIEKNRPKKPFKEMLAAEPVSISDFIPNVQVPIQEVVEKQVVTEPQNQESSLQVDWLENVKNARRGPTLTDPHVVTYEVQS